MTVPASSIVELGFSRVTTRDTGREPVGKIRKAALLAQDDGSVRARCCRAAALPAAPSDGRAGVRAAARKSGSAAIGLFRAFAAVGARIRREQHSGSTRPAFSRIQPKRAGLVPRPASRV